MFIEAREITPRPGHAEIDAAIKFVEGPKHGYRSAAELAGCAPAKPIDWTAVAILTTPIWFVVVGPEVAGVIAAGYVINKVRKALTN